MAYAALVSLAKTINQIPNHDHNPVNQDIISIRDDAVGLQSFLDLFQDKASSLEGRIREVADRAEDLINHLLCENYPSDRGSNVRLSEAEFERQLREVAEKVKSTCADVRNHFTSNDFANARGLGGLRGSRASSSSSIDDAVVGFEEDLLQICDRLVDGSSKRLQVLPIVGKGGVGKTTLAKTVYKSPLIVEHFDVRGWVTVSQDYSVGGIVSNLLASMRGIKAERDAESDKIPEDNEIRKYLLGRRYLIVMDDMWSKKAWDEVRKLFPDDENGSRVMLTTRLPDMAEYAADPIGCYHMVGLLSEDQSWRLFCHRLFGEHGNCPREVEGVGRLIAQRCRGLPISIVVVAGLLSKIRLARGPWEAIVADGRQMELETLMFLSYKFLPHHLKSCFLYMGGFPEDHEIRVSELIKLWIAEGFIKCPDGRTKSLEEEAEECLEDLAERRLVLVSSRKGDGKIKSCSLHDLVRDFCIKQGQKERLFLPVMDYLPTPILRRHFLPRLLKNHRRVSATWYDLDLRDSMAMHSCSTHSIICIPQKGYKSNASCQNFSLLRVLHVLRRNDYWDWKPAQVFDLIYLTYLASSIPTSVVPPAISKLQNLQTLIIYRSGVRLPVEIWRMRQLRHLMSFSFDPLPHPETADLPLENLQILSLATNLGCSGRMVEMIPNIKKLGICYSGEKFDEDYRHNNLVHLHQLEELKLEVHSSTSFWPSLNPVFPMKLKKLTLSGCRLPWRDMTIVGSLPDLRVLKLRNYACDGEHWETTKGEFDALRLLLIDESNLQHWTTEDIFHFPCLKRLVLHHCPHLTEIPMVIGDIPTLELIEVDDRNQSLLNSAKMILEEQQSYGNDDLQVRVKRF